jgi:hypothetical protein
MDKDVLQAVVNTLYCLDLSSNEKKSIITQWVIKAFNQSEAIDILADLDEKFDNIKPTIKEKSTLGNIIETYRDTHIWDDQKSYRGFVGTLIEEYSKIVKARREILNLPSCNTVEMRNEFLDMAVSNKLVCAVIERRFKDALALVGLRTSTDTALIAAEWFDQVTNPDMSMVELEFCEKLREAIASVSTKNTYSGTYNIGKIKNLYEKDDSKFPCVSVVTLLSVAQRVLTTFNGTKDSLVALLDYKGVDLSIEEIDSLIPESTRSTYPENVYERVHKALELFF